MSNNKLTFKENDIIVTEDISYPPKKLELFFFFLDNVNRGIKDSIRIIDYTFEGYPIIKNLSYDGNNILLIEDTRHMGIYDKKEVTKHEGNKIVREDSDTYVKYYLVNSDSKKKVLAIRKSFLQ